MPTIAIKKRLLDKHLLKVYSYEEIDEICFAYGLEIDDVVCFCYKFVLQGNSF